MGFRERHTRAPAVHRPPCGALFNQRQPDSLRSLSPAVREPGIHTPQGVDRGGCPVGISGTESSSSRQPDELSSRLLPGILKGWCSQSGLRLSRGSRTHLDQPLMSRRSRGHQVPDVESIPGTDATQPEENLGEKSNRRHARPWNQGRLHREDSPAAPGGRSVVVLSVLARKIGRAHV